MFRHLIVGCTIVACAVPLALANAQQPSAQPPTDGAKTSIAAIKLEDGYRASKIIGSTVYNQKNEQLGTVSDLFVNKQNQVVMVILSVGGVAGIGGKLAAVPISQLTIDEHDKVVMADGNKDQLNALPDVKYPD
jgi:sporulation protein YlmC with PRC-barrel domain